MTESREPVDLPLSSPIWGEFFTVAPLVMVGTVEGDGHDFAPKHMALPLGWENRFGFVCSPRHATQRNAERTGSFTVSFLRPNELMEASLAAAPREADSSKPSLAGLPVRESTRVEGVLLEGAYLWLECELDRIIDGFGENTLIVGEIVAAAVAEDYQRASEVDDADLIRRAPILAYVSPGRIASISETFSFPFPAKFKR